jgi:hypothetical protein
MRRVLVPLLLLALAAGAAAVPADAAKRPSCATLAKRAKAKVVKRSGPLTVYQRRDVVGVCDAKLRKRQSLGVLNPGTKVTDALGVRGRCAFVVAAGDDGKPDLYFKDLPRSGTNTFPVGFGQGDAAIGSIALASNCAAAWGEVSGGVYRIRATGITSATSLSDGTTDLATVAGPDDIAHVTAKAAGKRVTVGWTSAGARQSLTIPL